MTAMAKITLLLLIGVGLMSVDIRLPFFIATASAALGLLFLLPTWRNPAMQKITARPGASWNYGGGEKQEFT